MKTTAFAVTLLLLLMNVSTNAQYNYIPFTQPAEIYKKAKVKIKLVTYEYSIVNTGIPATTVYNREGNVVESYFFDSTGKKVSNHVKTSYDSLHRIQKTDFENYTRWDSTNKKLEILEKITDSNNYQTRYYYYDAANRISKICYKYFKSTDTHTIEFNYPDNETMIVLNDYPFLKDHNKTIETYKFEKPFVFKIHHNMLCENKE